MPRDSRAGDLSPGFPLETLPSEPGMTARGPSRRMRRQGFRMEKTLAMPRRRRKRNLTRPVSYTHLDVYKRQVTVTFLLNRAAGAGGSEPPVPQQVEVGGLIAEPDIPTWISSEKDRQYAFAGWYTAKEGGEKWNFSTGRVIKDTTLDVYKRQVLVTAAAERAQAIA